MAVIVMVAVSLVYFSSWSMSISLMHATIPLCVTLWLSAMCACSERMSEALCMRFNPQSRRRVRNNDCCVPEET